MAGMRGFRELDRAEIYRLLNPGQTYLGATPEAWMRSTLLKEIRVTMARVRREAAGAH